jgi:hypothetical protein
MNNNNDTKIAAEIIKENELERDARNAKKLLDEYQAMMVRMQDFIKSIGAQPQEPTSFCKTVMLTWAAKKLESKIVTLQ